MMEVNFFFPRAPRSMKSVHVFILPTSPTKNKKMSKVKVQSVDVAQIYKTTILHFTVFLFNLFFHPIY